MPYLAILQTLRTNLLQNLTTKISSHPMLKTLKAALEIKNLPAVLAAAPLIRRPTLNGAPPIPASRTQMHMSHSLLLYTPPRASSASKETG